MGNLIELIHNNPNIDNKDSVVKLLSWVETMIPKDCRENLYRNIKTATITLDETADLDNIAVEETTPEGDSITLNDLTIDGYSITGGYFIEDNILIFITQAIEKIWEESQKTSNPEETFGNELSRLTLHELIHLASSYYDSKTGKTYCGYNTSPADSEDDKNMGLTEGMTEYLSFVGVPKAKEIGSRYYIESLFTVQLTFLVGGYTMLSSFFANKGIKEIETKLNDIIADSKRSYQLFRAIENNYEIEEKDIEQSVMGSIQQTLIEYLMEKVKQEIENENFDSKAVRKMLNDYETMLVTEDLLKQRGKNPSNYIGIKESVDTFEAFKKSFEAEYACGIGEPVPKGPQK